MAHLLVICTANICRSPLVEALLRRKLEENGHEGWTVSSAGTWAEIPRAAARYSQRIASRVGLDLSEHRAQMVSAEIMAEADLVLVMTRGHKESLQVEFRNDRDRVFLMSEMIGRTYDVVDPYGGPTDGYEEMYREVQSIIDNGYERIVELAETNASARVA